MEIENWGVISYPEAWQRQTELFDELVNAKQEGRPYVNRIVFLPASACIHLRPPRQGSQYVAE